MRHLAFELRRKSGRRLADQVGLADARKEAGEGREAAGLRLAAGDPEDVLETRERLGGGIRVGRLGVVDEQHAALAPDLLHAMRKPWKRAQAILDRLRGQPERERRAGRAGGVLRVVHAAQRPDAAEMRDRLGGAAGGQHDLLGVDIEAR